MAYDLREDPIRVHNLNLRVTTDGTGRSYVIVPQSTVLDSTMETWRQLSRVEGWEVMEGKGRYEGSTLVPTYAYDRWIVAGLSSMMDEWAYIQRGLTPHEARVWMYVEDDGRAPSWVAEAMGISRQAVSNALGRARGKLGIASPTNAYDGTVIWDCEDISDLQKLLREAEGCGDEIDVTSLPSSPMWTALLDRHVDSAWPWWAVDATGHVLVGELDGVETVQSLIEYKLGLDEDTLPRDCSPEAVIEALRGLGL